MDTLEPGIVHLWAVPLDRPCDRSSWAFVSDEERRKALAFRNTLHGNRYMAAHVALRSILALYLEIPASAIVFKQGLHGRPHIDGPLQFNLSHSEQLALVAVSHSRLVGVDLEWKDPTRQLWGDRSAFASPLELEVLEAMPIEEREEACLRLWVRKEAFLKALGVGITEHLMAVSVGLEADNALLQEVDPVLTQKHWTIIPWCLPEFEIAVAVEGGSVGIKPLRWGALTGSKES